MNFWSLWTHFIDSCSWTFLTQILEKKERESPLKVGCWAARDCPGQHLSPWIHQVSEVIYCHPPLICLGSRMMTHASQVARSLRYTSTHLLTFQKKGNFREEPMLLCSDQHILAPQQCSCVLRSWNVKPECRLADMEKWNSNPGPPDSQVWLLSNYAVFHLHGTHHTVAWHPYTMDTSLGQRCDK